MWQLKKSLVSLVRDLKHVSEDIDVSAQLGDKMEDI
jgi:hypothetical protein